jgi:hypothetical protein
VGSLLRPRVPLVRYASGLVAADLRVTTSVTEYTTEAGAAAGFAFGARMDDRSGQDVPGVGHWRPVEATRSVGTEPESGDPLQRLDLAFQYGQLVGEVTVIDYRNAEPELATVERLAEALLARIGRVQEQGGAGLSTQALRLTPIDVWIEGARLRDFYVRQGGMDEHTFGQLAASVREDGVLPTGSPTASSGVPDRVDTYMFWTPVGDGDPIDLPLYVVWLDRYRSAERADAEISRLSTDLGPGYIDVHEFLTRERIGDQSRHFAYRFEGDPSGVVRVTWWWRGSATSWYGPR